MAICTWTGHSVHYLTTTTQKKNNNQNPVVTEEEIVTVILQCFKFNQIQNSNLHLYASMYANFEMSRVVGYRLFLLKSKK